MMVDPNDYPALRLSVGGHAAGAISGIHPFISPMQIYAELRARMLGRAIERDPPSLEMLMGTRMEPLLAELYREHSGHEVIQLDVLTSGNRMWRVGHPDGVWLDGNGHVAGGVDYKSTSGLHPKARWKNGVVPEYVQAQCQWYMDLAGPSVQSWDVWVSVAGAYPARFIVRADPEYQALLRANAERFLVKNVIPGIPPDADETESCQRALRALHPIAIDKAVVTSDDPEFDENAEMYIAYRNTEKLHSGLKTEHGSKLMAMIGDRYGLTSQKFKAVWATVKGRESLDTEGLIAELKKLLPDFDIEALRMKHTKAGPPGRRLTVTDLRPGDEGDEGGE